MPDRDVRGRPPGRYCADGEDQSGATSGLPSRRGLEGLERLARHSGDHCPDTTLVGEVLQRPLVGPSEVLELDRERALVLPFALEAGAKLIDRLYQRPSRARVVAQARQVALELPDS